MNLQQVLAAIVPLLFLIHWLTDLSKDVTNKNWNGLFTKVWATIVGFVVISIYAHGTLDLGGSLKYVANIPWQGLLLAALILAAGGGTVADGFRTFNRSDDGTKPKLTNF